MKPKRLLGVVALVAVLGCDDPWEACRYGLYEYCTDEMLCALEIDRSACECDWFTPEGCSSWERCEVLMDPFYCSEDQLCDMGYLEYCAFFGGCNPYTHPELCSPTELCALGYDEFCWPSGGGGSPPPPPAPPPSASSAQQKADEILGGPTVILWEPALPPSVAVDWLGGVVEVQYGEFTLPGAADLNISGPGIAGRSGSSLIVSGLGPGSYYYSIQECITIDLGGEGGYSEYGSSGWTECFELGQVIQVRSAPQTRLGYFVVDLASAYQGDPHNCRAGYLGLGSIDGVRHDDGVCVQGERVQVSSPEECDQAGIARGMAVASCVAGLVAEPTPFSEIACTAYGLYRVGRWITFLTVEDAKNDEDYFDPCPPSKDMLNEQAKYLDNWRRFPDDTDLQWQATLNEWRRLKVNYDYERQTFEEFCPDELIAKLDPPPRPPSE